MNVLIACEESQAVLIRFLEKGFNAFSCDLLPCSGVRPDRHIKADAVALTKGNVPFTTQDGKHHKPIQWDVMIAFPPCTHLAVSGAAWFEEKRKDGRQQQGIDLFMSFVNAPIKYKAIENPVGIMSSEYRPPDQIIQPYYFGDSFSKKTCLWLFGLPKLFHASTPDLFNTEVTHVHEGEFIEWTKKDGSKGRMAKWYNDARHGDHGHKRSKTFPGIAKAMAEQWSEFLINQ